ncbi:MAG: hypothetical protein RRC34_02600 [Lentisphaeria bacterium]|nr:hypothetical protein [Lentisphaeria bacterium]
MMRTTAMNKVRLIQLIVSACLTVALTGVAAETKTITLTVGAMEIVDVPFEIKGFKVADPELVRGDAAGRQLRVTGVKIGSSDIQILGEGGAFMLCSVTVRDNVKAVLAAMRRDLDEVPELELTANRDVVVIKGEVSNIAHWQTLQKVLASYEKQYLNLATFRPAPEAMMSLQDALTKAGMTVVNEGAVNQVGTLLLKYSGNMVLISGSVPSPSDINRINRIITAQEWLTVGAEERDRLMGKVPVVIDINVEPVMLELDVVYVGLSDIQNQQLGVNLAKQGLMVVDSTAAGFAGVIGSNRSSGYTGSYSVNSGLAGTLNFMAANGVNRFREAAHLTFMSNDTPTWREFHSGGTLKVRLTGGDGGTASLEDIDYGLMLKVKGGLSDSKTATMEVMLELSAPEFLQNGDYDLKRNRLSTSLTCELGKTMVMGGMKGLVENSSGPSGVPFLRSIPVIQWFFSESENRMTDTQVLVLLSPRLAGGPSITLPTSVSTRDTDEKASTPNKERMEKGGKKRKFFFF